VPSGDGDKTIEVRYQDQAGNISETYSATVTLDTTPPIGFLFVADDAAAVSTTSTVFEAWATDMNGVLFRIRNGGSPWPTIWSAVPAGDQPWTLPSGDGTKWVDVEFKDAAGNIAVQRQSVILDTTAPSGGLSIDAGTVATSSTSTTLGLTASDASTPIDMRLRDSDGAWGDWQPFRDTESWSLPSGDGAKTVEVQYRDALGNTSAAIGGSVLLDTVPPVTTDSSDGLRHRSFTLQLAADDATSGVAFTEYRVDGGRWKTGVRVTLRLAVHRKPSSLTRGAHTIQYRSTDNAGNVESVKSCVVILGL